jgi:hypothetical protein
MEEVNQSDNLTKSNTKLLPFIKFMYIAAALGVIIINFGNLESIIISRYICLILVMIVNVIMIIYQMKYNVPNKYVNVSLLALFILVLIMYIYYINKSFNVDKSRTILSNTFSNSFLVLFVFLSIYLCCNLNFEMTTTQYCVILVFCTIMICLLYPLIISISYYKTDGFKNIYIK